MARCIRFASAALLVSIAGTAAAEAPIKMGTAGLYRGVPATNCGQPVDAQMQGACDPPPVSESLPLAEKVQAHIVRAEQLITLIRMPQAGAAADQAVTLDPNNFAALKFRARLALNNWDDDTAWRDVNAALAIEADDSDLLATKAELRWRRQEQELAVQDATAAVKADPKNADAYRIRGRFLMIMNRTGDALADWNTALDLEPDLTLVRLFRSQTLLRMGYFSAAANDASVILKEDPHDRSALVVRATAYRAIGKLAEAVDDLDALLGKPGDAMRSPAADPVHRPLLLQRMVISVKLGRKVEAQRDLEMLLNGGGKQGVLQLQLYLRQNGFSDLPISGERSERMDDALRTCIAEEACLRGVIQRI